MGHFSENLITTYISPYNYNSKIIAATPDTTNSPQSCSLNPIGGTKLKFSAK